VAVGQFHPLVAIADRRRSPKLAGTAVHLLGDRRAVATGRRLARQLGLRAFSAPALPPATYHAAASLVAAGAVALCGAAARLLEASQLGALRPHQLLGPLLGSVAENLTRLGLPWALTGPVRRGDHEAVHGHRKALGAASSELLQLYEMLVQLQLPLARALGEAPPEALDRLDRKLLRKLGSVQKLTGADGQRVARARERFPQ
jgi:predicted short-subunit dehydrogenase-like oxidoreductase (DUF2520 family)